MDANRRRPVAWGRLFSLLTLLALAVPGTPARADDEAKPTQAAPARRLADDDDYDPDAIPWLTYLGIAAGVAVVGGIGYVAVQQDKKKKKKTEATPENVLGGYRLVNLMMTGQHSQVWEAAELASLRHFAIKVLLPEHAADKDQRRFLFHEAEVGKALAHPNIIRVISIHRDAKNPHFVMDFFPGGNLKLRILRKEFDFIKEHAQEILKQSATALAFINAKGWVHRDVKPENILVNAGGDVRVIDFAIAQRIPTGLNRMFHRFRRGKIQGTPSYMSPEQIRNWPLDERSDIYGFGCMAYEIVTGRAPFRAANTRELLQKHLSEKPASPRMYNPEVSEEFANLVVQMLAKDRNKRPKGFHDVLMILRKIKIFKPEAAKKSPAR
jgi:serine/threonine protein kinase